MLAPTTMMMTTTMMTMATSRLTHRVAEVSSNRWSMRDALACYVVLKRRASSTLMSQSMPRDIEGRDVKACA